MSTVSGPDFSDARDAQQLQLLAIFHYIAAALLALFALMPVIHLLIGIGVVSGQFDEGSSEPTPVMVGWLFIGIAVVMISIGMTMAGFVAYAGRCIHRRKRLLLCQVVAGVHCLVMPVGTVLGVFTLVVLMRPSVQAMFDSR